MVTEEAPAVPEATALEPATTEVPSEFDERNGVVSPKTGSSPPSSPRSVEGFVTSVELNAAPEQLPGALNTDGEAPVEQQSGPFSVYVSSSPEPGSIDAVVDATPSMPQDSVQIVSTTAEESVVSEKSLSPVLEAQDIVKIEEKSSSVEIVHAQSMVEVVAPPSPTQDAEMSEFIATQASVEVVSTPSPVYTPAPLNDLMSTSMILEQPISDAPEQVEEMMQFMTTSPQLYNLEQEQTAQIVHITSDNERQQSPEVESANLLDVEEAIQSQQTISPAPEPIESNPISADISQISSPDVAAGQPSQNLEQVLVEQMNQVNLSDHTPLVEAHVVEAVNMLEPEAAPVVDIEPAITQPMSPEDVADLSPEQQSSEHVSPEPCTATPTSVEICHTPVSDVTPSTPMKEPMINDRPISPIHTPKADIPVPDEEVLSEIALPVQMQASNKEILSEIAPPVQTRATTTKKAPVRPAPRSTTSTAKTMGSKPTTSRTTPTTSNVKPGTPRPSARSAPTSKTTPGTAVRSTTTPKTTPNTRTPTSRTPASRSTSATSTTTTRTTTTRTPLSSRAASASATRTTPTLSNSRPTPTSRTARPTTSSSTSTTRTTPLSAPRTTPSSRPTSTTTTPTTARRTPISRRTPTAAAKDAPDGSKSVASSATFTKTPTTRTPITRKPLYPGPKSTSTSSSTTAAKASVTEKKEIKNTTNKMLSTTTSTLTKTTASSRAAANTAPTHKPLTSRTTAGEYFFRRYN